MDIKPEDLAGVTSDAIKRYNKRYNELGYNVRSLGWGTSEQQVYRFAQTQLGPVDFTKSSILDIGCGFGDYFRFFKDKNIAIGNYTGVDINTNLIEEAKKQYPDPNSHFAVANLMDPMFTPGQFGYSGDISVMLGLLNFNLGEIDNCAYSELAIRRAFAISKKALVVDFLSDVSDSAYPRESFVFYHDPMRMLKFALTLSPRVTLKHNYASIPQREFMLFIEKE